ncbi:hypothetical protein SLEP1_g46590 [Rubroshorea leprosula]|uniref:Retrotransposon gag domain-containing protein n=1 Tax=Rubroshorea leprosula TaxID=152421 RepID=A0AAV5LMT6_9ROSI|nr:hypothetical protein SLEP1_g46590 [Rubroshorea leprosula]
MNNAKIVSWILASVDINIRIPMRGFRTAKAMWEHLEKVYQQSNWARKFQIEFDIFKFAQGDKNIQDYYAAFMSLWTEYEQGIMGDREDCCLQSLQTLNDERKNSVSSAITSAFSAIGLSGPSHWDSEREEA